MPEPVGLLGALPIAMLVFGGIVVAIVVSVFAIVIVRGLSQWRRNNASPIVTTMARVVTKRGEVHGGTGESRAQTAYFSTFETPAGDRFELALPAREFGLIADGDSGELTYQGTRFKGFARTSIASR
jgi:hypothetical protein